MLTQVAETLTEAAGEHCGGWCVTTLITDFLEIAGVMVGFKCQPFNLFTYWTLGFLTLRKEVGLTWHEAFLVLGQMQTSVGYGSHCPDPQSSGLKLWHGFHAWAGVMFIDSQMDAATSQVVYSLETVLSQQFYPGFIKGSKLRDALPLYTPTEDDDEKTIIKKSEEIENEKKEGMKALERQLRWCADPHPCTKNHFLTIELLEECEENRDALLKYKPLTELDTKDRAKWDDLYKRWDASCNSGNGFHKNFDSIAAGDRTEHVLQFMQSQLDSMPDNQKKKEKEQEIKKCQLQTGIDDLTSGKREQCYNTFSKVYDIYGFMPARRNSYRKLGSPVIQEMELDSLDSGIVEEIDPPKWKMILTEGKELWDDLRCVNEDNQVNCLHHGGAIGKQASIRELRSNRPDCIVGFITFSDRSQTSPSIIFKVSELCDEDMEIKEAEDWIIEYSKGRQNAMKNTNARRTASVGLLLIEIAVASLVYSADLALGRYNYDSDKDKTWEELYKRQLSDAFYLIMMSFSTVGYGDYAPSSDWGQAMSPLMMQMGTAAFSMGTNRMTNPKKKPATEDFTDDVVVGAPPSMKEGLVEWLNSCKDISLMPETMKRFWSRQVPSPPPKPFLDV